jgi:hypothetical protein
MSLLALTTAVALAAPTQSGTLPPRSEAPTFVGHAEPLPAHIITKMTAVTWREICPVPLSALSWLEVQHWGGIGRINACARPWWPLRPGQSIPFPV